MVEHSGSKRPKHRLDLSLRWKLALSYAFITTLSLLLAELLIYCGIIVVFSSHRIQNTLAEQVPQFVLPQIRPYLEQKPVNKEGVQRALNKWVKGGISVGINGFFLQKGGLGIDTHVYVLDTARNVVACLPDCGHAQDLRDLLKDAPLEHFAGAHHLQNERLDAHILPIENATSQRLGYFILTFPTLHILLLKITNTLLQSVLLLYPPILILGLVFGWFVGGRLTRRLLPLRDMVNNWAKGDFTLRVRDESGDEMSEFARQLNWVADELETLIKMRETIAGLEERQRIARELHDSVKQRVFAISLMLKNLRKTPDIPPRVAEQLESVLAQVREIQGELRLSIQQLHPHHPSTFDIYQALHSLHQRWQGGTRGISIDIQAERANLPPDVVMNLYRITEEAVSNAVRHSGASHVTVTFRHGEHAFELVIQDNGHGFKPDDITYGLGLRSMKERAGQIGAHFTLQSNPAGTTIRVLIPEDRVRGE